MSRVAAEPNDIHALMDQPPQLLAMGNIGHSQGLEKVVAAFEANPDLVALGARLIIAGSGVAADTVADAISSDRVSMPGVLYGDELTPVLRASRIGVVSQRADIAEFNLPSKLMNYMAHGLPVLASVNPNSETARIVRESGAGWVTDAARPAEFAARAAEVLTDSAALSAAGQAGFAFAREHFAPAA